MSDYWEMAGKTRADFYCRCIESVRPATGWKLEFKNKDGDSFCCFFESGQKGCKAITCGLTGMAIQTFPRDYSMSKCILEFTKGRYWKLPGLYYKYINCDLLNKQISEFRRLLENYLHDAKVVDDA